MKRVLCLMLALMMILSLGVQSFADDDVLFCRICGKQIPTDSRVCPYCGEKVVHITPVTGQGEPAQESAVSTVQEAPAAPAQPSSSAPADTVSAPATATDVKTALSQSSAPSPFTQTSQAAVPGPFNTTVGAANSAANHVRVTKSPTSESVPYGGSCAFIAHAANATSVTWYIANADASVICAAYDAPSSVSGLYVSGANDDTLYLSGIPSWWNGCQVQACFTGEGGPVYTEVARIWTYQPVVQSSSCWPFWFPWNCGGWDWDCGLYTSSDVDRNYDVDDGTADGGKDDSLEVSEGESDNLDVDDSSSVEKKGSSYIILTDPLTLDFATKTKN